MKREFQKIPVLPRTINLLQEFSVPLIIGVVVAIVFANVNYELYSKLVYNPLYDLFSSHKDDHGHGSIWGHIFTLHFLINDVFMVIFFGIATKEITEALLPGGALSPINKAINVFFATLGGIIGPVLFYFILVKYWVGDNPAQHQLEWIRGWGIPTATDIALAWLVARLIFGKNHPAVIFLVLLAVGDDAIGLGIIAIAYPDPEHQAIWGNTWWILPGMAVVYFLRKLNIKAWQPYIFIGGGLSWWGLYSANLHPALALVPIVPFLPWPKGDVGLFKEEKAYDELEESAQEREEPSHSTLENFEHDTKLFVDFGLFFFAFANAGAPLANISNLTWAVFLALLFGKTIGVFVFATIAHFLSFKMPKGMDFRDLFVLGIISSLGLTVSLFIAGEAFVDKSNIEAAKMGALISGFAALIAFAAAKILGIGKR